MISSNQTGVSNTRSLRQSLMHETTNATNAIKVMLIKEVCIIICESTKRQKREGPCKLRRPQKALTRSPAENMLAMFAGKNSAGSGS